MEYDAPQILNPLVKRFCRQYLQAEPAPDYPNGALLREDNVQEYIYSQLFSPDSIRGSPEFQLPPAYTLKVLKTLVAKVEASIDDWEEHGVSDNLMQCLANFSGGSRVASLAPVALTDAVRKHRVVYYISSLEDQYKRTDSVTTAADPSLPTITLLENRTTIAAGGTTGIRTWEAALHLGEYLCRNRDLVRGKRVLELGAGTGYISILCAKHLGAESCVATDGSTEVVNALPANLELNGLGVDKSQRASVVTRELVWGPSPPPDWRTGGGDSPSGYDVILGADVTFDDRVQPDLLATIRWCLSSSRGATVLISAAERNKKTFDTFTRLAAAEAFDVDDVGFPICRREDQAGPFYSDDVPFHICRLLQRAQ